MKKSILTLALLAGATFLFSQASNIISTNPTAEQVLLENYDVNDYLPSNILNHPDDIVEAVLNGVSPDSLKSYLFTLSSFETRHTSSDTVSATTGIGAARRWVYERFQQISAENENRLLTSYLQFDQDICGMGQHRNIFAVLPGINPDLTGVVLIEAHLDSRCHSVCDSECTAHGMEDNGSGTALVIELARVMSGLAFDRTVVFMATIGEEQGLHGADAFATWAKNSGIEMHAVLNNDVIGGVICGETSSAPSCPGLNHIDSTQVRLFSQGSFNSKHKQLARFIKLQYQEELFDLVSVPMLLTIMSAEDRTGRGGDHIPFRENGFAAMRFTSANEHGNAAADIDDDGVQDPDYHDRQHTSDDLLGVDTDGDMVIDSFFVDFNYLSRNAVINGNAAGMAAIGPVTPEFEASKFEDTVYVNIFDPMEYGLYRIFFRSATNDFDTVFTVTETSVKLPKPSPTPFVSVAAVDENGVESLFTGEELLFTVNATGEVVEEENSQPIELFQNRPNPFDEATTISFHVKEKVVFKEAFILISDLSGREIKRFPVRMELGVNEVLYDHGYNKTGVFAYSLVVDGKVIDTKRMVFAY